MTSTIDTIDFLLKPAIAAGTIIIYDKFVSNLEFNLSLGNPIINDALIGAFSILSGSLVKQLLFDYIIDKVIPDMKKIDKYVLEPVISGVIYQFLYDTIYRARFRNNTRQPIETLIVGSLASLIGIMLENPLFSMITTKIY